jgi:hypothetical protein
MVIDLLGAWWLRAGGLLAQASDSGRQLAPEERARVLVALSALALLSVFLIALAWVALRMVRRYVDRSSPEVPAKSSLHADDWADRPIVPPE